MKVLELARGAYGVCELVAPGRLSAWLPGRSRDRRTRTVIRILGARHLLQALLSFRAGRGGHRLGGAVDLTHAASMVLLAAADRRRRTAAAASAAVALAFAVAEFRRR